MAGWNHQAADSWVRTTSIRRGWEPRLRDAESADESALSAGDWPQPGSCCVGYFANHQRIGKDRGAERASLWLRVRLRRASLPSVVEPARSAGWRFRRTARRHAFCFLGGSRAAITCAEKGRIGPPEPVARQRPTVGAPHGFFETNLTPGASTARQVRRGAAGFNE